MNQLERRLYLINHLLNERNETIDLPEDTYNQKRLLRGLMNIRMPDTVSKEFIDIQNDYLQEELKEKGITSLSDLEEIQPDLYVWQGDITTLECDAIVNAANSQMLGCFCPNHGCIDNAIHTYAGIQLRNKCAEIMHGESEETGKARITPAYNLPCSYVIHTVGPIVAYSLTQKDCDDLRLCYKSCLKLAESYYLESIAFCCISTGEFHFPPLEAAQIAIQTVKEYKEETKSKMKVIFNVFKDSDKNIYEELLRTA